MYILLDFFYLHPRIKGRRRERNLDVREKHRLVASYTCPDRESNPQPFGYGMTLQPTRSYQPGLYLMIFLNCYFSAWNLICGNSVRPRSKCLSPEEICVYIFQVRWATHWGVTLNDIVGFVFSKPHRHCEFWSKPSRVLWLVRDAPGRYF